MNKLFAGSRYLLTVLLFLLAQFVAAQQHGNEWINFNQQYVKISVAQDGIYKVTYQDLQKAGIPVGSLNPRNLQLYHRGAEQAIFVEGESNNIFDPEDFVLFFGRKNDGTQDKELYRSADAQPHAYYNLYSDTTAYFLTFNLTNAGGKRMSFFSENNINNAGAEPWYLEERLMLYTANYSGGITYSYGGEFKTQLAYGDYGEGFTGEVVANGQSRDITFENLGQQVTAGPAPVLEVLLTGRNNIERQIDILAGSTVSSLQQLHSAVFTGGRNYLVKEPLSWSQLNGGRSVARVATSQGERVSVSYAKLSYARSWDMGGLFEKVFNLPAGGSNRRYVEVKNVPSNVQVYDITDPNNVVRIGFRRVGATTLTFMLSNGTTDRKLFLSGVNLTVPSAKKVNFRKINPALHNYLIVSHPVLRTPAGGYPDPVKAYAAYRASVAGGGFDTLLVNVGQLYDQFGYGEITPVAIRRLVTFMASGGKPEYLFLIGKGLDVYYNYYRNTGWTNSNHDLVPTFGYPGADIPFVARLNGSGEAPAFPVGRLGARTPQEVVNYFNKVQEAEGRPVDDLSRKKLVHLSGGSNQSQALQFKRYLREFEDIAVGKYLGGKVETVSKTSELVVQEIDITKQVNEGVGLVTFFGHSGTNITDMEIGYVSDDRAGYRNKGKYPCILVNGCDAGDIFSTANTVTFGEDWIFTADRGALNVLAHSGIGYTNLLRYYSGYFYEIAYADLSFIDASIGKIQAETIRRFLALFGVSEISMAQAHEMIIQGDPAVKLFGRSKPDFETNNQNMYLHSYSGGQVNLAADSFAVAVVTRNFGRVMEDSLPIRLNIKKNGGPVSFTEVRDFKSPFYQDTLYYVVWSKDLGGPGMYEFEVQLNPDASVEELNLSNNKGALEVVLQSGGTINLLPKDFSIVQGQEVELYFQNSDPFKTGRGYLLEVDTSFTFSSRALQQFTISGDALIKQKVKLPQVAGAEADSIVYFWRTKLQHPEANEDVKWVTTSFTVIKNSSPGWAQLHPEQFRGNQVEGASVNEAKEWTFDEISRKVEVITFGPLVPESGEQEVEMRIDDVGFILGSAGRMCQPNSINAVHFAKAGLDPHIAVIDDVTRTESCGRLPQIVNNFLPRDINFGNNDAYNLEKFLADVPEDDYVLLFSIGKVDYELWPPSVKEQLISLGADPAKVAGLTNGEPYILLGKKGGLPGSAIETYADKSGVAGNPSAQIIRLEHTIESKRSRAIITTPLIGPAKEWQELACKVAAEANDSFELQLIGVDIQMKEHLITRSTENIQMPLAVSPQQYPYLKLRMFMRDEEDMTPPELEYWHVSYTQLPEGVVLPAADTRRNYTLDEGQDFQPSFRFINITENSFSDSLQVEYSILNTENRKSFVKRQKIAAPSPYDTTWFDYVINTDSYLGRNDVKVHVNPQLVPEAIYSNNLLDARDFFFVRKDTVQPVVDVAFDGVYITNGSIVSPRPLITVYLRDNNRFKFKQDTVGVNLFLKKECEECEAERISLAGSAARWKQASENEPFQIEFQPEPLADGIYTLQVQGEDASNNKAGVKPYSISFEVITESSVTNFYPYPNPFSTSTRFVFTLTGSEIPDDIKIQIMTIDGRVVREILKEELGPIRIGSNISDFAWDGKDEWGDQLANGVYLYKVFLRHSGDAFEHRETKGDKAFRKGFGKMYLLR